jgi:hypothetical protein
MAKVKGVISEHNEPVHQMPQYPVAGLGQEDFNSFHWQQKLLTNLP